jgi:hypothetical protein
LAAKEFHYKRIIAKSNNKIRSTWKIINEVKGKTKLDIGSHSIVTDNKIVVNQNKIANAFNKYSSSIADSIILDINRHTSVTDTITLFNKRF